MYVMWKKNHMLILSKTPRSGHNLKFIYWFWKSPIGQHLLHLKGIQRGAIILYLNLLIDILLIAKFTILSMRLGWINDFLGNIILDRTWVIDMVSTLGDLTSIFPCIFCMSQYGSFPMFQFLWNSKKLLDTSVTTESKQQIISQYLHLSFTLIFSCFGARICSFSVYILCGYVDLVLFSVSVELF